MKKRESCKRCAVLLEFSCARYVHVLTPVFSRISAELRPGLMDEASRPLALLAKCHDAAIVRLLIPSRLVLIAGRTRAWLRLLTCEAVPFTQVAASPEHRSGRRVVVHAHPRRGCVFDSGADRATTAFTATGRDRQPANMCALSPRSRLHPGPHAAVPQPRQPCFSEGQRPPCRQRKPPGPHRTFGPVTGANQR